jgi:hypothetical protein
MNEGWRLFEDWWREKVISLMIPCLQDVDRDWLITLQPQKWYRR